MGLAGVGPCEDDVFVPGADGVLGLPKRSPSTLADGEATGLYKLARQGLASTCALPGRSSSASGGRNGDSFAVADGLFAEIELEEAEFSSLFGSLLSSSS
jgi:hypothetical protein